MKTRNKCLKLSKPLKTKCIDIIVLESRKNIYSIQDSIAADVEKLTQAVPDGM